MAYHYVNTLKSLIVLDGACEAVTIMELQAIMKNSKQGFHICVLTFGILTLFIIPVLAEMSPPWDEVDLIGTNMEGFNPWEAVNSPQQCSVLCDSTPGCVGATYVLPNTIQGPAGHCWRKSEVTGERDDVNCISFVKLMGYVSVESTPEGARVFVRGVEKGTTPLTIRLPTGSYSITLMLDGYKNYNDHVIIENERKTPLDVLLQKIPTNTLTVLTQPTGAEVSIDGKYAGISPLEIPHMEPGSHRVAIVMRGYEPVVKNVGISDGNDNELWEVLVPITIPTTKAPGFTAFVSCASLVLVTLVLVAKKVWSIKN